jgi:3-oxosteroid 1-dehydrogenase
VNEAAPYVDTVHAMYERHSTATPHIPCWLIFDQRYKSTYVFAGRPPGRPFPRQWYEAGAVYRAPTLAGLAGQIGADIQGLDKTVARFGEFAQAGTDEDFRRGDSAYDRTTTIHGGSRTRTWPRCVTRLSP